MSVVLVDFTDSSDACCVGRLHGLFILMPVVLVGLTDSSF